MIGGDSPTRTTNPVAEMSQKSEENEETQILDRMNAETGNVHLQKDNLVHTRSPRPAAFFMGPRSFDGKRFFVQLSAEVPVICYFLLNCLKRGKRFGDLVQCRGGYYLPVIEDGHRVLVVNYFKPTYIVCESFDNSPSKSFTRTRVRC